MIDPFPMFREGRNGRRVRFQSHLRRGDEAPAKTGIHGA
jgi:hypothetical protein